MITSQESELALEHAKAAVWKLAAVVGRSKAADLLQKVVNEMAHGSSLSQGRSQFDDTNDQWGR